MLPKLENVLEKQFSLSWNGILSKLLIQFKYLEYLKILNHEK